MTIVTQVGFGHLICTGVMTALALYALIKKKDESKTIIKKRQLKETLPFN